MDQSIQISPNPSGGATRITFKSPMAGTLRVFDALGRLVTDIHLSGRAQWLDIDISQSPAGLYRVVVFEESGKLVAFNALLLTR